MKKTWDVSEIEIIPMRVSPEEYNQLLEEFAEMVYTYFSQLSENQTLAPETNTAIAVGRTGTDE